MYNICVYINFKGLVVLTMETLKLFFSDCIFIGILAYIILPFMLFYKSSIYGFGSYNTEFLSKKTTDCIKGLSILVVILHHISLRMQHPGSMLIYTKFGYLAVSMFLFFSGYGLMISKLKKQNYFKGFFSKRLSKVYIPFIIINMITLIALVAIYNANFNIKQIIFNILGLSLIDSTQWFVITIMVFYVFFYLSFRFLSLKVAPHVLLALTGIYFFSLLLFAFRFQWIYNTAFCFPIGVYTALHYDSFMNFIKKHYIFCLIPSLVLFLIFFSLGNLIPSIFMSLCNTISSVLFVFVILLFLFKVKLNSKPLLFISTIAYELYIIHMKIMVPYFNFVHLKGSYTVYIYLIITILVSFMFSKFFKLIRFDKKAKLTKSI